MSDTTLPPTEETPVQPMRWPPPGLGRIQGDLWIVARKMALVGTVLVVPLLIVLTLPHSPYGLGPLGEAWWITLLTTFLGLALFIDAVVTLVRFLFRVRRALAEGYTRHVVALVVADRDRDHGFLLQGVNVFCTLRDPERRTLGRLRFLAPLFYLVATTWLVVGFGLLILLAAHGAASLSAVGFGTLAPAAFIWFFGLVLRATEGTIVYRARESWHREDWADDLARHEIDAWQDASEERGFVPVGASVRGAPAWPRVAVVIVLVGSFVAALPAMTLVPASSLGSVLASMGAWSYEGTLRRWAEAEAYRPYRVAVDSSVSALEAGELLHVIARAGYPPRDVPEIRDPVRAHEEPWLEAGAPAGFRPEATPYWTDTIWTWVERGLTEEEAEYLRRVANHPARGDFSRLASAPSLDFVRAFYVLPFDEDMTFFSLPFPRTAGVRSAANSHLAQAALQASEGRMDEAERSVREVISVGFVLADEAPTLIANLVGAMLARGGGDALVRVVALNGEPERAAAIEEGGRTAEAVAERMSVIGDPSPGGQEYLQRLPVLAEDPRAPRALRWEAMHLVTVFSPCANLRRVVFGPDEEYDTWVGRVRSSLVRYESEEALFEVSLRGIAPTVEPGPLTRLLSVAMGGGTRPGSCAQVLTALPEIR